MDRTSMGRYWTEDSANYGRVIASEFGSFREDAWKGIFSLLLPQAPAPVLDFGCGPGFFTLLLSELGYDAQVRKDYNDQTVSLKAGYRF